MSKFSSSFALCHCYVASASSMCSSSGVAPSTCLKVGFKLHFFTLFSLFEELLDFENLKLVDFSQIHGLTKTSKQIFMNATFMNTA